MSMPLHSSGDSTMCSLPTAKVVDAMGILVRMPAAAHCRPDEIRLRRLDLRDGRAEIGDVEREVILRQDLAAIVERVFLHPLRGDLAVIVVGGDDIDLLAPFLDRKS